MKMERIESSEMSALKAQTPGDYPKDTIRKNVFVHNAGSRRGVSRKLITSGFEDEKLMLQVTVF